MLQEKRIRYSLLAIFILLYFATRVPGLGTDVINPDAVNWHYRTQQFVVALKQGEFEKTYQHYHPGVTLMWIAGAPIEALKQIVPEESTYNHHNFIAYHFTAKYTLVVAQLVLTLVALYILSRIIGFYKSIAAVALFSFEPFFIGNSRLLHLDVLVTLFLFIGVLISYTNLRQRSLLRGIIAGFFLAAAFLTKSIAIGGVVFASGFGFLYLWKKENLRVALKYALCITVPFAVFVFIMFPAMWVNPVQTISAIFNEAERVGIRKGHGQIVLGEYSRDPGITFYPLVLLIKASPALLLGLVLYLIYFLGQWKNAVKRNIRARTLSINLYLLIFYFGYIAVMTYPTKKIDRYIIPVFPAMTVFSVYGYYYLMGKIKSWAFAGLVILASGAFVIYPAIKLFPYLFTYTSPLVGSSATANRIVAQKPFGVGIYELRQHIFDRYGYFPSLGFIDKKPMAAIYMNSRIHDIRVSGTSDYGLLVMAINEEIPQEVLDSGVKFVKDSSVYINGLEYWRIYVKEN